MLLCIGRQHATSVEKLPAAGRVALEVRADQTEYRGPAGVVRDVTLDLAPTDTVMVAEAARVPVVALRSIVEAHRTTGADATVGVNPDESPAGVFMLRASVLERVPALGFMDLKEQLLSRLVESGKDIRVHRFEQPGILPCRTRGEFVRAAMTLESDRESRVGQPVANPGPAVISQGASIDPTAYVSQCVIGPTARVESGAVVVRSLVIGTSVVRSGASISDAVITPAAITPDIE